MGRTTSPKKKKSEYSRKPRKLCKPYKLRSLCKLVGLRFMVECVRVYGGFTVGLRCGLRLRVCKPACKAV